MSLEYMGDKPATETPPESVTSVSGEKISDLGKPPSAPFENKSANPESRPFDLRAAKAKGDVKDELKPLPRNSIRAFESVYNTWSVRVHPGMTTEDFSEPEYFRTIADLIQPGDIVHLHTPDFRKRWRAVAVTGARHGPNAVRLHVEAEFDCPDPAPGNERPWEKDYRFVFNADTGKWDIFRRSDNQLMSGDGVNTYYEGEELLRQHATTRVK